MDIVDDFEVVSDGALVLRSRSPIVFMYPSLIMLLLCGFASVVGTRNESAPGRLGMIFIIFLFVNLTVLGFKYTRRGAISVGLVALFTCLLGRSVDWIGDAFTSVFGQAVFMNASFYGVWLVLLGSAFLVAHYISKSDSWIVCGTELVRNRVMGPSERYPITGLLVATEVDDVVRFMLLRSGHLSIFQGPGLPLAQFRNVPHVKRAEVRLRTALAVAQSRLPAPQSASKESAFNTGIPVESESPQTQATISETAS
jgi:hypothetical protein